MVVATLSLGAALVWLAPATAAPRLANYWLSNLPADAESLRQLARHQVVILNPEEVIKRPGVTEQLRQLNPDIILLAYVPAKSYFKSWGEGAGSPVYRDLVVRPEWWLRDSRGNVTSDWPGHQSLNLQSAWSDYWVEYIKNRVLTIAQWDGIFLDVVYDGIAWFNQGDIDLDGDGRRDDPAAADAEWRRRTVYLLERARQLPTRHLVINGSSDPAFQPFVNGRLYENFPTPWEASGSWSRLMNKLAGNQPTNAAPRLSIFNANTNNRGNQNDWRRMRFGLGSSLLLDAVYFSFDWGTENHGQLWWYDEYEVSLGNPISPAVARDGATSFSDDVWRREYAHGVAIVNATESEQTVELGADYERLNGTQDQAVNDGSISDTVELLPRDGLIMLRTFQTLPQAAVSNGSFARFFTARGGRARNGFFAFDESLPGNALIYQGDLDGEEGNEKVVATGAKLEIFNTRGERWFNDYPLGANFNGGLQLAVGSLNGRPGRAIAVAPGRGSGEVRVYNYRGEPLRPPLYPLGKTYRGGFSVALSPRLESGEVGLALATAPGRPTEVLLYDRGLEKVTRRWFPFGRAYRGGAKVALGDIDGDSQEEVVVISAFSAKPRVRIFDGAGRRLKEFTITGLFSRPPFALAVADVNFDGKGEIVVMSSN